MPSVAIKGEFMEKVLQLLTLKDIKSVFCPIFRLDRLHISF